MAKHPESVKSPKKLRLKKLDALFKADVKTKESTESSESLWGSTLLYSLLLVRPWILVGSFWVVLMVTIAIALGGLSDPGKPTAQDPIAPDSGTEELTIAPDAAATSRLPGQAETLTQVDPAAALQGSTPQPMPVWPLWVMVLACAGGCFMMSRQGVPAPSLRRSRGRRQVAAASTLDISRSRTAVSAKKRSGQGRPSRTVKAKRKSLARKSSAKRLNPQYPSSQVMAVKNQGLIRQVTPTKAQAKPLMSASTQSVEVQMGRPQPVEAKQAKIVSFNMKSSPISVVPSDQSLPLDWQGESLAHRLDERQKRTLNSLL